MSEKKQARSYRRFSARLERAVEDHQRKLDNHKVSVAPEAGKLVIILSTAFNEAGNITREQQRHAFIEEAEWLEQKHSGAYNEVVIKKKMYASDFAMDLADAEVAGIVLIGHGNIGDIWTDGKGRSGHFGAFNVAKHARYLKQGRFEQRVCGHFRDHQSVPFGTFAVADQRNLIAPVGIEIDDINPDEALFRPVYDKPVNSADDIRNFIAQGLNKYDVDHGQV